MKKTKETRGRKKLPDSQKKVAIYIMVPGKNKLAAQVEINKIGEKYCA